jgi:hypothetical protein
MVPAGSLDLEGQVFARGGVLSKKALSHIAVVPFFFVVPTPVNFRKVEIWAILVTITEENLKQGWYNPDL